MKEEIQILNYDLIFDLMSQQRYLEHISAALGRRRNHFRAVNLHKIHFGQRLPKQTANSRLHAEYRLIGHRPQVYNTVVQSRVLVHVC